MLETGRIIGGLVERAGQVIVEADVAMKTLVEALKAQELSSSLGGGGAAFALPIKGARVVRATEGGAFPDVEAVGSTLLVQEAADKFQVSVGDVAVGVRAGDKASLDVGGERHAPDHGVSTGAPAFAGVRSSANGGGTGHSGGCGVPNPTGTMTGSVVVAVNGGGKGNKFVQTGGALLKVGEQVPEVIQHMVDGGGKGDA